MLTFMAKDSEFPFYDGGEPCADPGMFVGGTVNWFARFNESCVIVSLHLEKESYQEISQPAYGMPD